MSRRGFKSSLKNSTLALSFFLLCPVVFASVVVAQGKEEIVDLEKSADASQETINERYNNGKIKIKREVIQDSNDNYINHGAWAMFDPQGRKVAEGNFENGERQGLWTRWLSPNDSKMLTQLPYKEFPSPFISQAQFDQGQLSGTWTIFDARGKKISQWSYKNGERDGAWTWWYPNGKKLREMKHENGDIVGTMRSWNSTGHMLSSDTFEEGRKLAPRVSYHGENRKKSEGMYLFAQRIPETNDDWWNTKLAKVTVIGKDEKHGAWRAWHKNGQVMNKGEFRHGLESGKFTWYHTNGQRSVTGEFDKGRKVGKWTWWHAKGQKSSQGEYSEGAQTGKWVFWDANGKVKQRADFSGVEVRVVDATPKLERQPAPAKQAVPRTIRR